MFSNNGGSDVPLPSPQEHSFTGPSSRAFTPQYAPLTPTLPVPASSASAPPSPTRTRSDRPPRPMNAWLLFRTAQLRQMQEDNPGLRKSQGELSKIISEMWKTVSPEVKQGYEDLARQRKIEHQRLFPDYRYSPTNKPPRTSKPKRTASTGSPRAPRPSLRISPSQHAFRPASYEAESELAVADSVSTSASSSANDSPRYAALPTPSTATWSLYEDFSPPGSAQPTYENEPAPPQSAPPTMAHFPSAPSALGLVMHQPRPQQQYDRVWDSRPQQPSPSASHSTFSYAQAYPPAHSQTQYLSPPSSATHPAAPYPSSGSDMYAHGRPPAHAHRTSYADPSPPPPQYWTEDVRPAPAQYAPAPQGSHRAYEGPPLQPLGVSPSAVYGVPVPAPAAQQWSEPSTGAAAWDEQPYTAAAQFAHPQPVRPAPMEAQLHLHLRHRSGSSSSGYVEYPLRR